LLVWFLRPSSWLVNSTIVLFVNLYLFRFATLARPHGPFVPFCNNGGTRQSEPYIIV
jgi:hypothetical protein